MRRRDFVTLLSGAAAWPLAARAQSPTMPVIGLLNSTSPDGFTERLRKFSQGLKEQGFVEGENDPIHLLRPGTESATMTMARLLPRLVRFQ